MGSREKLRENIDLNSSDSTSVRGGSTATIRSGEVDHFIKSATEHYASESDSSMLSEMQNINLKSNRVRSVVRKHAGKEHSTDVANASNTPAETPIDSGKVVEAERAPSVGLRPPKVSEKVPSKERVPSKEKVPVREQALAKEKAPVLAAPPVNRKETNGAPTLSTPIKDVAPPITTGHDIYGDFKTAYNQAIKQDLAEDNPHQES